MEQEERGIEGTIGKLSVNQMMLMVWFMEKQASISNTRTQVCIYTLIRDLSSPNKIAEDVLLLVTVRSVVLEERLRMHCGRYIQDFTSPWLRMRVIMILEMNYDN